MRHEPAECLKTSKSLPPRIIRQRHWTSRPRSTQVRICINPIRSIDLTILSVQHLREERMALRGTVRYVRSLNGWKVWGV